MEINGVYRFYQEGELVATHKNILTDEGIRLILRYMSGYANSLGGAISVGVSDLEASSSDVRLGYEVYRADVAIRNPDYINRRVVFKGTIPQDVSFVAYEAGLWSTPTTEFDSVYITLFSSDETWTNASQGAPGRINTDSSLTVEVFSGLPQSTRTEVEMDLSVNSSDDTFSLAFTLGESMDSIMMVFENTITGGQFTLTKDVSSIEPGAYTVMEFRKGDFTAVGAASWDSINSLGFDFSSSLEYSSITLDGLRVEDNDRTDQGHVLVSRTVFDAPMRKNNTAPMDVEYALEFTVS